LDPFYSTVIIVYGEVYVFLSQNGAVSTYLFWPNSFFKNKNLTWIFDLN
jgi:hypothetical protein